MAVRVQNLSKKNFDGSFVHSLSNISVGCQQRWNSNELARSLPQNISLKVKTASQLYQNAKPLDLQLPDQESNSAQATRVTDSPYYSSESGVEAASSIQDESCGKDIEGQMKPVFLLNNANTVFSPSHPNYNHSNSMACAQYSYANPYFGGLFTPYGQQAIIQAQMAGSAPARIPLPLDLAEGGPIYVNAKQYHGILRRRRYRAKLEAQNKLVKSRKPYIHESRHLHALNRVRGSGGRFLSRKKPQQPDPTFNTSSHSIFDASCLDQKNSGSERESHSRTAECTGSSTTCSDISSVSNTKGINFQQPNLRFMDVSHVPTTPNGMQHCASVVL